LTEKIHVRELVDFDLPETLELLRVSLGETVVLRRSNDLFSWKHWDNPFGRSISLVATAAGRIVGLRTFMRWRLRTGGDEIECVRPVDTATHPDFQRRGIFRDLTMHAIDAARGMGVHLVFNTPNDKSRPGYLSMGWSQIGHIPIQAWIRPIRWFSADRERIAGAADTDVDVGRLLPQERDGLHTPQTPEYLRWRYLSHPTVTYTALSAEGSTAVFRADHRKGRAGIAISDVYGEHQAAAMRAARRSATGSYVVCSFPPHSRERGAALRSGLIPLPGVHALTLVARPLVELDIDPLTMASWHLTLSDVELL
jgi:GNAT superfamily N-acetyltransferase